MDFKRVELPTKHPLFFTLERVLKTVKERNKEDVEKNMHRSNKSCFKKVGKTRS